MKDKDGNLLTEDSERRKRWQKHFEEILNRPIQDNPVSNEPNEHDERVLEVISTDCISKAEIRAAIRKMRNGKSGGKDEITVELLKADIDTTIDWLDNLFMHASKGILYLPTSSLHLCSPFQQNR